ncbi:MAG: hypothetical protein ABIK09_15510 [Pseudomonadota bacterium]
MRTLMTILLVAALAVGCGNGKKSGTDEKKAAGAGKVPSTPPAGLKPMVGAGANPHGGALPPGHGQGDQMPVLSTPEAPADMDFSGVVKAVSGHSIDELYAQRADLAGKVVKVRGLVVKFSPQIMGTNWVHVQDGTGAAGSNDLTVTTSEELAIGDSVLIEGPLSVDEVMGHGMKYTVLIQSAKIVVEKKD